MTDIKGSIQVTKTRFFLSSDIQYNLLFLKDRLLFIKAGGQFRQLEYIVFYFGAIAALVTFLANLVGTPTGLVILFSALASGVVTGLIKIFKDKKKSDYIMHRLEYLAVEDVIGFDKNNFEMLFNEIMKIELKRSMLGLNGFRIGILRIESKNKMQFDITSSEDFDKGKKLISSLIPNR